MANKTPRSDLIAADESLMQGFKLSPSHTQASNAPSTRSTTKDPTLTPIEFL